MVSSGRPVLLVACLGVDLQPWREALVREAPDVELRFWPEAGARGEIDYVLVWNAPADLWEGMTDLRVIFSMGAGVDKLFAAAGMPDAVPLVRMVDPGLVTEMVEFIVMRVLHYHRRMPEFEALQRAGQWRQLVSPPASDRRVGILGAGQLGMACARTLQRFGFDVACWARTPKPGSDVPVMAGDGALAEFAGRSDIVICLLPLTEATEGILDHRLFEWLPHGAFLINAGRGRHLVEEDLLAALASGRIAHATLDVFLQEPLPTGHPFWSHPAVTVVPHCSALTRPGSAAATLAANLRRDWAGEEPFNRVERTNGY